MGTCEDPISFTQEMREKRRKGEISNQMNITYYENLNEIQIFNDSGRARRPLIIVKNGIPLLRQEHLYQAANGFIKWDDFINNGIIEYLDAEEEENSYIAMTLEELTEEHTHLEIDPATMLGICAGIIPFSNHNSSPRNTMEAGMSKQALGVYASNYEMRTDIRAHLLHYPQTPIVKTRIIDSTSYDLRPSGQNFVVALMSYEGYNMEDAMVINKASLERGLARSTFFRSYDTLEKRYYAGQVDKFERPDINVKGYRSEDAYRNLDGEGIINPESYVESGDVLIGRTSPPRFFEEDLFTMAKRRRETSLSVRHGEKGIVDAVILSETSEGSRLAKIRVRDTRQPEYGDKFASRHGQKGVIGLILSPEDVPFTEFGLVPDLIVNPHMIPSRMSVGQILEMVAGKAGCLEGERVDATPFNQDLEAEIKQQLIDHGFESAGCESLYNGVTGERFEAEIFIGVSYYQRLHHMAADKIYARARGPVQILTRQPTEGRLREGGLRFGEMERDALIAHGAAMTLKERLLDESDKYEAIVCDSCGMLALYDRNRNRKYCPICGDVETYPVEISYAFKLLLDELISLCIFPKLVLGDKTEIKKPFKKKHNFEVKPFEKNRNFISRTRLSDEEPTKVESDNGNCIVCGKKLNKHQKNVCKACSRKQYASRIVKKLVDVVKPGIAFKKQDMKALDLSDLQIQDYIWTLQEFNLVEINNNKFKLKDESTLNKFRIESKMNPIDFDSLNDDEMLNKTCKTCGRTLHISKFYKNSEGYAENCKECTRLIRTAKYLNDIIFYIGFENDFKDKDLQKHIPDLNHLMGVIWSLQENDLLIETEFNSYQLADKEKCFEFLERYFENSKSTNNVEENKSNIDEQKCNVKNKTKSIHKKRKKSKDIPLNSKDDNERKQIEFVLKLLRNGKSKSQVIKLTEINESTIVSWYNQGKNKHSENTIYFYNEFKKIKNSKNEKSSPKSKSDTKSKIGVIDKKDKDNVVNNGVIVKKSKDIKNENIGKNTDFKSNFSEHNFRDLKDEKQLMNEVLSLMRKGYSRIKASQEVGIKIGQIVIWYTHGRNNYSENTIYFYNQLNLIEKNR